MSTDEHGHITVYNAAMLNLLDTNTAIENQPIDTVLPVSDTTGSRISLIKLMQKLTASIMRDDLILDISGEPIRLEMTLSPIRRSYDGSSADSEGYIVIARDITTSKSLEEERDEFISVVSHELRTPITIAEATISNVQLMMDRGTFSGDHLKTAVDTAHDQVMFLARMVNDLSTLSRAERGIADEAEEISVAELARSMATEYKPQAEGKGLKFTLNLGSKRGTVLASRLYLQELLQNFITNAIKYTKEGSVIFSVQETDDSIQFTVKDSGIGISKADQKRIFERFYRAEDYRTRETSGTGLGLYVTAKLAKKLGTTIEIESRLNHGSSFSIKLPRHSKES